MRTLHLATEIIDLVTKSSLFAEEKIAALEIARTVMIAEGNRVTAADVNSAIQRTVRGSGEKHFLER